MVRRSEKESNTEQTHMWASLAAQVPAYMENHVQVIGLHLELLKKVNPKWKECIRFNHYTFSQFLKM